MENKRLNLIINSSIFEWLVSLQLLHAVTIHNKVLAINSCHSDIPDDIFRSLHQSPRKRSIFDVTEIGQVIIASKFSVRLSFPPYKPYAPTEHT
jgi:hypothetical protein